MDQTSFDRIARLLGGASTRRQGLAAALGGALGLASQAVSGSGGAVARDRRARRPRPEGPCGDGSRKDNLCTKNSQCCTNICNTELGKKNVDRLGRCRCMQRNQPCKADRNCCNTLTCNGGVCALPPAPEPGPAPACVPSVCPSGCPFSSVQAAVTAAAAGSVIQIGEGTYVEVVTIGKNLTLEACTTATIRDTGGVRTLNVTGGAAVELRNVIIDGTGSLTAPGGGVDCEGKLTLSGTAAVTNGANHATGEVGGINLHGAGCALVMKDSAKVTGCNAGDGSGAVRTTSSGCTVAMSGASEISNNFGYRNGGGVYLLEGSMTMSGTSKISSNTAGNDGGGVYLAYFTGPGFSSLAMTENAFITLNVSDDGDGSGVYSNNAGNTLSAPSGAISGNSGDECAGSGISC